MRSGMPGPDPASSPLYSVALAAALYSLSLVGSVVHLVLVSGRGIDITDSGYYLLASRHPEDVLAALTSAHQYTALLLRLVDGQVAAFRVAGLALLLVSGLVFALGLQRMLAGISEESPLRKFPVLPGLLAILGSVLFYGWTVTTPGYNLLVAAALQGFAGWLLLSLPTGGTETRLARSARRLSAFLAGACVGVVFFAKFPTAIALVCLHLGVVAFWPAGKSRIDLAVGLLAGLLAWAAVHFLAVQDIDGFAAQWGNGFARIRLLGSVHGQGMAAAYLRDAAIVLYLVASKYWWVYALVAAAGYIGRHRVGTGFGQSWGRVVPAAAIGLFGVATVAAGFQYGGDVPFRKNLAFYVGLLFLLLVLHGLQSGPGVSAGRLFGRERRPMLMLVLILLLLPVCGAAGTANPLRLNMMLHLGPWFALLGMGLLGLSARPGGGWTIAVGSLLVAGVAASQVITGGEVSPYRLNAPLSLQSVDTGFGPSPGRLKLDEATSRFIGDLRELAAGCGLKAGDDVLAFTGMPGLVYGLDARSPGIPWYSGGYPGSRQANTLALRIAPMDRVRSAWVLVKEGTPEAIPDFTELGIRFPAEYDLCGGAVWPVTRQLVRLWRPKDRHP